MVRKRLFLTLLILFILMSAIGCAKNGGTKVDPVVKTIFF